MFLRLFWVVFLLFPVNLRATDWSELPTLLPKGTQVSYMVVDPLKNTVIAQSQQAVLRTPASIQKLLTATAATLYLGHEFRYQTAIQGQKYKINNGIYRGDLRFHFVGDPTLLRSDIRNMLVALKNLGVSRISGDLLINQAHFSGYQWSDGQAWNDLGVCYTAPANAIIVNKNCVLGNLSVTSQHPEKARLFIPGYEPVDFSSDVAVVTSEQRREQFCALEVTRNSHNQYHLWGCMVARKQALPLAFAINDPFSYAQQIIAAELTAVGIQLAGKVTLDGDSELTTGAFADRLVSHTSAPLAELLQVMMKESDNLIADSLFKTLGAAYFQQPGNFRNGSLAIKNILKAHGVDLENAYLADGSGLSRHNLMSAELFMAVLNYVYQHDQQLNLLTTLAVAGVDGTLKNYRAVQGRFFRGKVIAKTGSMKGVANLLGLINSDQGIRLFVLILNGYNLPDGEPDDINQAVSKYRFQQAFIKNIMLGI